MLNVIIYVIWLLNILLTAYPAVYGQFPQAIPQPIAAVPAQREGKKSPIFPITHFNTDTKASKLI